MLFILYNKMPAAYQHEFRSYKSTELATFLEFAEGEVQGLRAESELHAVAPPSHSRGPPVRGGGGGRNNAAARGGANSAQRSV